MRAALAPTGGYAATLETGHTSLPLQSLVDWVSGVALPYWATCPGPGPHPFAECLDSSGRPHDPGYVRLRVIARQTAVFAKAALAGHEWARYHALAGWGVMKRHYWSTVSGWAARVGRNGEVRDLEFGLYDQAFAIYACAAIARLEPQTEALALAERTSKLIDRNLRARNQPGWRSRGGIAARDQNSHMHYLEALLAIHEVAPSHLSKSHIEEMLELVGSKLIHPRKGVVQEWFDDAWRPIHKGAFVEPGHQYEWCWLLARARKLGFQVKNHESRLFAFAQQFGVSDATGLLVDGTNLAGRTLAAGHRLWPHCEAIRACTVPGLANDALAWAEGFASQLLIEFICAGFPAGWLERLDPQLRPVGTHVPATSLYHLWEAAEALVAAGWARWPEPAAC